MQKQKIGWIGLGVMATHDNNLLKSDYELCVFTRTKQSRENLQGARWLDSPDEIANTVDVIITMVRYPSVEEVYFGPNGIFGKVKSGTVLIDMTTSCPGCNKNFEKSIELNADSLDAPVAVEI